MEVMQEKISREMIPWSEHRTKTGISFSRKCE